MQVSRGLSGAMLRMADDPASPRAVLMPTMSLSSASSYPPYSSQIIVVMLCLPGSGDVAGRRGCVQASCVNAASKNGMHHSWLAAVHAKRRDGRQIIVLPSDSKDLYLAI